MWSVHPQGPKPTVKQTAFVVETLSINTVTMILVNFVFAKIWCYFKVNIFHTRIITQLRKMLKSSREKTEFCSSFNGFTGLEDFQSWQWANPDFLLSWTWDNLTVTLLRFQKKDLQVAQEAVIFLATQIWFQVLIWFDSNPFVLWDSFWTLCSDQAEHGPMSVPYRTHHWCFSHMSTCTNTQNHTYIQASLVQNQVFQCNFLFTQKIFVLRNSTKREK